MIMRTCARSTGRRLRARRTPGVDAPYAGWSYRGRVSPKPWKPDIPAVLAGRSIGPGAALDRPPALASTFRYGVGIKDVHAIWADLVAALDAAAQPED